MIDYQIVVPSRKRAHNMETIRWLLPTAKICIDEREVDDYAPFVEKSRLIVHPPIDGLPGTINWMMDNIQCECLVEIDDDFCGVQVNVGSKRFITDSEEILAIIENAMICTKDLGLTAFCWSRTPNTTIPHCSAGPMSTGRCAPCWRIAVYMPTCASTSIAGACLAAAAATSAWSRRRSSRTRATD